MTHDTPSAGGGAPDLGTADAERTDRERTGAKGTGMERIAALAALGEAFSPIAPLFGMRIAQYDVGSAVVEALPTEDHVNTLGTVHGGFLAAVLDSACGLAVLTTLRADQTFISLDLKVDFLRAVSPATGPVRVEGRVTKPGSRAAFSQAEIRDSGGRLLATATSALLVFPRDDERPAP